MKFATGGDRRSEQYKNQGLAKLPKVEKPIITRKQVAVIAELSRGTVDIKSI